MSVVSRKRKRKVFNLESFGEEDVPTIEPKGAFRDNILLFLRECAVIQAYNVQGMRIWLTILEHPDIPMPVPLYTVVQEDVELTTFCEHCRSCGWSSGLVCKRNYHLIIPDDGDWRKQLADDVFDVKTHCLHGLIHCNGRGHLLCITGMGGGSKHLRGREIMNFWDRICSHLHARIISLQDTSKKRGFDLRLVFPIAYGESWFSKWHYEVLRGNFGVTDVTYRKAIHILSTLPLDQVISDFGQGTDVTKLIAYYTSLSVGKLRSLQDLLYFMLTLAQGASSSSPQRKVHDVKNAQSQPFHTLIRSLDTSKYSAKNLEDTADFIVQVLKKKKVNRYRGMTRQDLKDAVNTCIGNTGLIDHVVKSMDNVSVGSHVVHRVKNQKNVFEYFIVEVGDEVGEEMAIVPGADFYTDVAFLYSNVLLSYPRSELIQSSSKVLLDTKVFVKKWPLVQKDPLQLVLQIVPEFQWYGESPPGEIVVIPVNHTGMNLKEQAQKSLRSTYRAMENFVVTGLWYMDELQDKLELEDEDELHGVVQSGEIVYARGTGVDHLNELSYEGGPDQWKIGCKCGAKYDDGERLFKCQLCGVWLHTRCYGIEDCETVVNWCGECFGGTWGDILSASGCAQVSMTDHEEAYSGTCDGSSSILEIPATAEFSQELLLV